ncbi:MAG: HAD hydrolase-like protein [Tepidisphaeraceae bacterium]
MLMVGDNLENDVEAPMQYGLNAALYAPGAQEQTISTTHGTAPVIREWRTLIDLIDVASG